MPHRWRCSRRRVSICRCLAVRRIRKCCCHICINVPHRQRRHRRRHTLRWAPFSWACGSNSGRSSPRAFWPAPISKRPLLLPPLLQRVPIERHLQDQQQQQLKQPPPPLQQQHRPHLPHPHRHAALRRRICVSKRSWRIIHNALVRIRCRSSSSSSIRRRPHRLPHRRVQRVPKCGSMPLEMYVQCPKMFVNNPRPQISPRRTPHSNTCCSNVWQEHSTKKLVYAWQMNVIS